jgi:hypothetical protein
MKNGAWVRYLMAAALILLVGAVWALAGETEMKVEVKNKGGEEITVDVNGVTEVITLDDLAPGEERTWDVGGHPFTVKRVDDHLTLVHEGGGPGEVHLLGEGQGNMVWVTEEKEGTEGAHKVIIKKLVDGEFTDADGKVMFLGDCEHGDHDVLIFKGEDGEIDVEALKERFGDDFEETHTGDGQRVMKWVSKGEEGHPVIIKTGTAMGDDFVVYRCEETGSVLTVKKSENLLDSYIDPVTACVMKKMEGRGMKTIRVEVVTEDETED